MRILFLTPPLNTAKGYPTLTGNRQFQYFKDPTFIYPLIPAQLATKLKREGNMVEWQDCIAEPKSKTFFNRYDKVFIEAVHFLSRYTFSNHVAISN